MERYFCTFWRVRHGTQLGLAFEFEPEIDLHFEFHFKHEFGLELAINSEFRFELGFEVQFEPAPDSKMRCKFEL